MVFRVRYGGNMAWRVMVWQGFEDCCGVVDWGLNWVRYGLVRWDAVRIFQDNRGFGKVWFVKAQRVMARLGFHD